MPVHTHDEYKDLVLFCRATGNERRAHSLRKMKREWYTVQQLADEEGIRRPAMSRHMHILLRAKLVVSKRRGKEVFWTDNPIMDIDLILHLTKYVITKRKR